MNEEVSDEDLGESRENKVNKLLVDEELDPSTRRAVDEARQAEWNKFERFGAAVPVVGREKDELVQAGHEAIPSKWSTPRSSSPEWFPAETSSTLKVCEVIHRRRVLNRITWWQHRVHCTQCR